MKPTLIIPALLLSLCLNSQSKGAEEKWTELLDSQLTKWELWMGVPHTTVKDLPTGTHQADDIRAAGTPLGLKNDPKNVFSMIEEDGKPVLKITGEIYGGLTSLDEYENYQLSFEVKFGEKKWKPRLSRPRDSGLLYHCSGPHGAFWNVWMRCLEYQVQEENMGDLYLLAGTKVDLPHSLKTTIAPGTLSHIWDPKQPFLPGHATERSVNYENPHGQWTRGEIFVLKDKAIHVVNGHVVLALDKARLTNETPLTRGKIQIQSEGAEAYYRNVKIRPITEFPEEYVAASRLPISKP